MISGRRIVTGNGSRGTGRCKFLKDRFHQNANLKIHNKKGVFDIANKAFDVKGSYVDDILDVDEIWLVFDTEVDLRKNWSTNWNVVRHLRARCKNAVVKLYMTKGCIEYYFLLHYEKARPLIVSAQDKVKILKHLSEKELCPGYKKGDKRTIWKLAERYETAIKNGEWCLKGLSEELKTVNEDERIKKLYFTDSTFTNTHEAVRHLLELKN